MSKPKQVILVRTDLEMDLGKAGSQIAHAAMKVFFDKAAVEELEWPQDNWFSTMTIRMSKPMHEWKEGDFTKVLLAVESEEQLLALYAKAKLENLPCSIILDNGTTVFNGVKTYTTAAIGPSLPEDIDKITGALKLYKQKKLYTREEVQKWRDDVAEACALIAEQHNVDPLVVSALRQMGKK